MPNHTVTIRFSTDKRGRPRAHYWGLARRWLPIGIDEAEIRLATDPRYVAGRENNRFTPLVSVVTPPYMRGVGSDPADTLGD